MKIQAEVAYGERKGDDGERGESEEEGGLKNQNHMQAESPVLFPIQTSWPLLAYPSK